MSFRCATCDQEHEGVPFEGPNPVREVSFVRIREHLRREVADAIVDTLLATCPTTSW